MHAGREIPVIVVADDDPAHRGELLVARVDRQIHALDVVGGCAGVDRSMASTCRHQDRAAHDGCQPLEERCRRDHALSALGTRLEPNPSRGVVLRSGAFRKAREAALQEPLLRPGRGQLKSSGVGGPRVVPLDGLHRRPVVGGGRESIMSTIKLERLSSASM